MEVATKAGCDLEVGCGDEARRNAFRRFEIEIDNGIAVGRADDLADLIGEVLCIGASPVGVLAEMPIGLSCRKAEIAPKVATAWLQSSFENAGHFARGLSFVNRVDERSCDIRVVLRELFEGRLIDGGLAGLGGSAALNWMGRERCL